MIGEENEDRLKQAFMAERGCENFKVIAQFMRDWLAELDANNRVPGNENRTSGAQVLAEMLSRAEAQNSVDTDA